MEYDMGVGDRLVLLGILPPEGNLATIRIVRKLREALSFDEAEHADAQIVQDGDMLRWNKDAPARAIEIGAKGQEIIRSALGKLDKEEKLAEDHISLCDLFEYVSD